MRPITSIFRQKILIGFYGILLFILVILMIIVLIASSVAYAYAQASPTTTPTSSFTPFPTEPFEAFVQNDLQIVSGNVQRPNGIYWYDGYLWTACAGDSTVYRIDAITGETITYVTGVQNTHSLYVEPGPNIWVADFQRNVIAEITTSPRKITAIVENLGAPWGLAAADEESFYVTQFRTADLIRVTREGEVEVIAQGFRNPTGIALDEDFIYVANNGSARRAIEWVDLAEDATLPLQEADMKPLVSGLQNTTNIIIAPDEKLYIAYALGTRGIVGRIDPAICRAKEDGCTNADVEIVLWSELAAPLAGLTISPDMKMYVHTMFGAEIYWVQLPSLPEVENDIES